MDSNPADKFLKLRDLSFDDTQRIENKLQKRFLHSLRLLSAGYRLLMAFFSAKSYYSIISTDVRSSLSWQIIKNDREMDKRLYLPLVEKM